MQNIAVAPRTQLGADTAPKTNSLAARTLRMAAVRIALVAACGGGVSYFLNHATIERAVREQLLLSTEQILQRESLPFREIRELEQNFLADFAARYADPAARRQLARDFDLIFYRHADGSYTQRPGLFEGSALPDGRRYPRMSATYAPDIRPDADVKARFALSYELSYQYGSSARGRLFNFYGVLPEKGFPIHQDADIAQAFTYSGPDALDLNDYEFYTRGFDRATQGTFFTRMYWDYSNNALMTTIATPGEIGADGKRRIVACVDVLLAELTERLGHPPMPGSHSTLFLADEAGTLIYHPDFMAQIKASEGKASLKSIGAEQEYRLLEVARALPFGKVEVLDVGDEIVAVGRLSETPGVLAVHYPRALMQPAILQNLAVVAGLALLTLLVELFIIRSVLQRQVAEPLARLIGAMRRVGHAGAGAAAADLPLQQRDEIGELARSFDGMARRVADMQAHLEDQVQLRTEQLEAANHQLLALSTTDGLTGVANRRRFDEVLEFEWRRAQRTGDELMLVMVDVDWFKAYNDHYGHQAGDECLRRVARLLEAHAQRAGDLVARYGGEEFAFIISAPQPGDAEHFARNLLAAMTAADLPHEASPLGRVTLSIGIATLFPAGDSGADKLLLRADAALYRAKSAGRNRYCSDSTPVQS